MVRVSVQGIGLDEGVSIVGILPQFFGTLLRLHGTPGNWGSSWGRQLHDCGAVQDQVASPTNTTTTPLGRHFPTSVYKKSTRPFLPIGTIPPEALQ